VFTRSGSTWTQQGEKLTGTGAVAHIEFGSSVALSADGDTALIGGRGRTEFSTGHGAAWVFTRSGSTWTQQGEKLTGGGEVYEGFFGGSVALSADGNTALIGGWEDNLGTGAAWAFTRSGSTWTQQGEKLTGAGEVGSGFFGASVALSPSGDRALVGGPDDNSSAGAAWVFTRSGSTWTQQGSKLTQGENGSEFGSDVALSSDGAIKLIGAPLTADGAGWLYANITPTVTKVEPGSGRTGGGTSVTLIGTNFTGASAVKFGSANATSFHVNTETSITAVVPPGDGTVDVTVITPEGTSPTSPTDHFTYEPPTVHGEFSNWVLSGVLHIGKLNQDVALPEGSRFNGTASINLETQSGPLSGTVTVPTFNAMLKILGAPATVGLELTQVGSTEGSIGASTAIPGDFTLTLPTKANIGFSSITIFGLKMATKCVTSEPLAFNLLDTLPLEELLSTGAQFVGTTKFPVVKCEGTNGTVVSSILTSLFSGPSNPYSIMLAP
jgi:hypothetical protein